MATSIDHQAEYSKLYWRCQRGMLELDILLDEFFRKDIRDLSSSQIQAFETLLRCPDNQLLDYLMGRSTPIDLEMASVVEKIRHSTAN